MESLLPQPDVPKRRAKQLPPDFVPRRSGRLAKKGTGAPSAAVKQVQTELARRLGLVEDREVVGEAALEEYRQLFNRPLSQSHVRALAALFGWAPPDQVEAP